MSPEVAEGVKWRLFTRHARIGDGCWEWAGPVGNHGYGRLRSSAVDVLAHRYAYETFVGPIPSGLCIDHLCRNRVCVRPDHLEAVTLAENTRREWMAVGPQIIAAQRSETCKSGHPWTAETAYVAPGQTKRYCRICKFEGQRRRRARRA